MNEAAAVVVPAEAAPTLALPVLTLAERLTALVDSQPGSSWTRFGDNGVEVRLVFDFADGSRVAGVGINTAAAVTNLEAKLALFAEAMSNA